MTPCNRAPAIENAAQYIEGTLSQSDSERFEDHYWNCPACLAYLQALEAVGDELARKPVPQIAPAPRKRAFAWPAPAWALGAVAALAVLAVIGTRTLGPHPEKPSQAQSAPAVLPQGTPSTQTAGSSPVQHAAAQLADLALPVFATPNLRGAGLEAHFEQGMTAYARGDCQGALAALSKVPAHDKNERKAEFYSALCRLHEGDFSSAEAGLRKVVDAGESLQLESALYYLAQIDLARNDPAGAHRYLARTISLQGDLEKQARLQDQKVLALDKMSGGTLGKDGK
jgi:hypothetical protein